MSDALWVFAVVTVCLAIFLAIRYERRMQEVQDAQDAHEAELLIAKERLRRTAELALGVERARAVSEQAAKVAEEAMKVRPKKRIVIAPFRKGRRG